jgi:hypothetical protein
MAWIKSIKNPQYGAIAEYWEVLSVYYNHRRQVSILEIGGWVDKAEYDNNSSPLLTRSYEIPSGLAPELAVGAVAFVSGYAKAQPEFEGWENA